MRWSVMRYMYTHLYTHEHTLIYKQKDTVYGRSSMRRTSHMGWLRSVKSIKLQVSFAEYRDCKRTQIRYRCERKVQCCEYIAVCCSVLHRVAVCCTVLHCVALCCRVLQYVAVCCSVLQCLAVCCSALHCVAVCCSVLQCAAVCCSLSVRIYSRRVGY